MILPFQSFGVPLEQVVQVDLQATTKLTEEIPKENVMPEVSLLYVYVNL